MSLRAEVSTNFKIVLLLVLLVHLSDSAFLVERQYVPEITVRVPGLGIVRGSNGHTARTGQPMAKFYNIRYAEPPTGPLRFKAPVKAIPWTDIRDASVPGRECPQPVTGLNQHDEDCLTLSVFTKNLTGNYPVMFYIHGGAFYIGSAEHHPPDYLLERDVLLVVVQYRLGPLGFLSTLSDAIPGNAAMLDIIMALEWVQDHINTFGGNPQKVTLFGQSAGAGAISGLLYSPLVPHNLFNQVILQSGGSISPWAIDKNPVENTKDIAKYAGCNVSVPLADIERCLMVVSAEALVNALRLHSANRLANGGMDDVGGSGMVVGGPSGFLPRKPFDYVRRGEVRRDVQMMGGVTKQDGSFMLPSIYDALVGSKMINSTKFIQYDLLDMVNRLLGIDDETGALSAFEIEALYSEDQLKSGNFTQMFNGLVDIAGAMVIKGPLFRDIQTNVKLSDRETYLYSFDYEGEHTRFGYETNNSRYPFKGGVYHSNDNIYLFPYPSNAAKLNVADTKISEIMVDLWTSFAIDGVPRTASVPQWPPMKSLVGPYLHINSPAKLAQNFYEEFSVTSRTRTSSALRNLVPVSIIIIANLLTFFQHNLNYLAAH